MGGERTVRNMRSSGFSATQSVNAVHLPIPPLAAKRVHRPRAFASITVIFYTCLAVLLGSSSLVKSWLVVMGIRNVWMPRSGCMHALISSRKPGVEKAGETNMITSSVRIPSQPSFHSDQTYRRLQCQVFSADNPGREMVEGGRRGGSGKGT